MANRARVEFILDGVASDVGMQILDRSIEWKSSPKLPNHAAYCELGEEVYVKTIAALNRIIGYLRARKGQYWVRPIDCDPGNAASFFVGSQAIVVGPEGKRNRWQPPLEYRITVEMSSGERGVAQGDWSDCQRFLDGGRRPDLVGELFVHAEELAADGHNRAALVQAVTAVEVQVSRYLDSDVAQAVAAKRMRCDLGLPSLTTIREKLGLRGTMALLLPILLSPQELPRETVDMCTQAIDARNVVAHKGQRESDDDRLRNYLREARRLVVVLDKP